MKRHAGEASFSKDEKILNTGLSLAMDWGPDWLRPIQERLSKTALELTKEELDQYNSICQEAMKYGHEKIHELAEKYGSRIDREEFYRAFKERYGWATKENMDHCFSQGMYYAWKDGLV